MRVIARMANSMMLGADEHDWHALLHSVNVCDLSFVMATCAAERQLYATDDCGLVTP